MATQTVKMVTHAGWSSPTMQARDGVTDAAVGSPVAATAGSDGTVYSADFADLPAGLYRFTLLSGVKVVASGWVDLTLTTADFWVRADREVASGGGGGGEQIHPLSGNC